MKEKSFDYLKINKTSWNARTIHHLESEFYNLQGFLNGQSSLNSIESELLGDLNETSILHLQCHFGQDTLSMSRLGAHCTGVDLSDEAIKTAQNLNSQLDLNAHFLCCDVYDLPNHLDKQFDVIYTSYGVIGWLPDMNKWAAVISKFLKPKGRLVFVEFHPLVWMFDDDFRSIKYSYFNEKPIIETETGTYAQKDANITNDFVCWNHAMSDVLNALIHSGLEILQLNEYDYSPYDCFNHTVEFEKGKFRIKHLDDKIPMVYAIEAKKPSD